MRNQEISFVNIVLCILVMWIHICSVAVICVCGTGIFVFVCIEIVFIQKRNYIQPIFMGQMQKNWFALCDCCVDFLYGLDTFEILCV